MSLYKPREKTVRRSRWQQATPAKKHLSLQSLRHPLVTSLFPLFQMGFSHQIFCIVFLKLSTVFEKLFWYLLVPMLNTPLLPQTPHFHNPQVVYILLFLFCSGTPIVALTVTFLPAPFSYPLLLLHSYICFPYIPPFLYQLLRLHSTQHLATPPP